MATGVGSRGGTGRLCCYAELFRNVRYMDSAESDCPARLESALTAGEFSELRTIIPNFPQRTHPLTIRQFMIEEKEELDGIPPVEWLIPSAVLRDPAIALFTRAVSTREDETSRGVDIFS